MFKAIQHGDRASLRTLAKTFTRARNDPAALLCLDHLFSFPIRLLNLPLAEIQALLSLFLDYIRLLNKFVRFESLAQGSNHQMLFGFQVLGENSYLVPEHTLVYKGLINQSESSGKRVDDYRCSYDELSRCIIQLILGRIRCRTEIQNETCREAYGFSPCLRLLVRRKCDPPEGKGPCPFQHIQLEQLSVDWYHARLRLILLQFKILSSARYFDWLVTKYVLGYSSRIAYGYSPNVKLLARETVLSASSTFSEARIDC